MKMQKNATAFIAILAAKEQGIGAIRLQWRTFMTDTNGGAFTKIIERDVRHYRWLFVTFSTSPD